MHIERERRRNTARLHHGVAHGVGECEVLIVKTVDPVVERGGLKLSINENLFDQRVRHDGLCVLSGSMAAEPMQEVEMEFREHEVRDHETRTFRPKLSQDGGGSRCPRWDPSACQSGR